jgi:hypothetical protein
MKPNAHTQIKYSEPVLPGQDPHITREDTIPLPAIVGQIRRVTNAGVPDYIPTGKGLDQFALKFDGFNKQLYIYDFASATWYGTNIS